MKIFVELIYLTDLHRQEQSSTDLVDGLGCLSFNYKNGAILWWLGFFLYLCVTLWELFLENNNFKNNKNMMKKSFFVWMLAAMLPMLVEAATTTEEIGGIKYELDSSTKKASVVEGSTKNSGDVVIPETVTTGGVTYTVNLIDYKAFYKCSGLTSVTMPNTVYFINSAAFSDCTSLKSVTLSTGLMYLYSAFTGCSSLTSIHIPAKVQEIVGVFEHCDALETITVDKANTTYDSRDNCNGIVLTAENKLVAGCKNTKIPSSVPVIGDYAFRYLPLTSIDIPDHVTTLGYMSYGNLSGIKSIVIPNSVTTIDGSFDWCKDLEEVTIGKGVTTLGKGSFQDCQKLRTVKMLSPMPLTIAEDEDPFNSYGNPTLRSNITLYVPQSAVNAYKNDSYWKQFKEVLPLPNKCETPVITENNGKLTFSCATEGVAFSTSITKVFSDSEINPNGAYTLTVIATKEGYEDSDAATKIIQLGTNASSGSGSGSETPQSIKGDVNADGKVDIVDVTTTIDIILNGGSSSSPVNVEEQKAVDLGLSVKWAPYNVGTDTPEGYGGLFAWGETLEKENYSWGTYKYCNGSENTLTKYCTNGSYGTVDGKTVLDPMDDVARLYMGKAWRIPTKVEMDELVEKCTWTAETLNGVNGFRVTGPNGNSIFLPFGGNKYDLTHSNFGSVGYYSTTSFSEDDNYMPGLCIYSGKQEYLNYARYMGLSVRAVYAGNEEVDTRMADILPADVRKKMEQYMPINNGIHPPKVDGTFKVNPFECVFCEDGTFSKGYNYGTDIVRFSNQNMTNNTLDYDHYFTNKDESGSGPGCFISGDGNYFTAYFIVEGSTHGVYTKSAHIISGTVTESGIKDFYRGLVMLDKGNDPNGYVMKVGYFRVWKDGDALSEPTTWNGSRVSSMQD